MTQSNQTPNPPPRLRQNMCFGFNVKTGSLLTEILDFTYDKGLTIKYDNATYDLPDQVADTFQTSTKTYTSFSENLLKNEDYFSEMYSISTEDNYSTLEYSGSLSSELTHTGDIFTKTDREYYSAFGIQECASASWSSSDALSCLRPSISNIINNLPKTISSQSEYEAYMDFFENYGTHYLQSGTFGGYYVAIASIHSSFISTSDSNTIKTNISGAFKSALESGSVSAGAIVKDSSYLSQYQESISISMSTIGGSYSTDRQKFYQSCFGQPVVLLGLANRFTPAFVALASLVSDTTRQKTMLEAMDAYLTTPRIRPPSSAAFSTVTTAQSDTIMVGYINCQPHPTQGELLAFTDASTDPTTVRGMAAAHRHLSNMRYASRSAFTMPVRKDEQSNVEITVDKNNPFFLLNEFRIVPERGRRFFGEWSDLQLDLPTTQAMETTQTITATTDGFLSVNMNVNSDQQAGETTVHVGSDLRGACSVCIITSADTWNNQQSFCVPICKGETYTLTLKINAKALSPIFKAAWLPVTSLQFQPPSKISCDQVLQAKKTDGFLVAVLQTQGASTGQVTLHQAPTHTEVLEVPATTGTSVQNESQQAGIPSESENFIYTRYNTATMPVPRGLHYNAHWINTTNWLADIVTHVWWIPLVDPEDPPWSY